MDLLDQQLLEQVSQNTIDYRHKQWVDNFIDNITNRVKGGYGVISLLDTLKFMPCIIVGSGPTLDYNIHLLKDLQDKACIISCDSAAKALLDYGVHPHLILSTDSKGAVAEFFKGMDLHEFTFILDTFAHPDTAQLLIDEGAKIYWYNTLPVKSCSFSEVLNQWTGYLGNLGTGGCVATTIWSLAVLHLGCDPTILVGLAEAYYDKAHQYASCVEKHNHQHIDMYASEPMSVKDIYNRDCWTQPGFDSFRAWFEDAFLWVPGIFINCSEGGILRRNILNMRLQDVADRYLTIERPITEMLFQKEYAIDDLLAKKNDKSIETLKPMLMTLLDGPSANNLSLRMGWDIDKVMDTITMLRNTGWSITEQSSIVEGIGGAEEVISFTLGGVHIEQDDNNENTGCYMCQSEQQGVSEQEPACNSRQADGMVCDPIGDRVEADKGSRLN
jgi:hypothetical protein